MRRCCGCSSQDRGSFVGVCGCGVAAAPAAATTCAARPPVPAASAPSAASNATTDEHGLKRRIVKLCVYVVLGAFANVAVAWGLLFAEAKLQSTFAATGSVASREVEVWGICRIIQVQSGFPYESLQRSW